MYKNILVPIVFDHDPSEKEALAVANSLVGSGGKITLLHIVEEMPVYLSAQLPKDFMKSAIDESKSKLKAIAKESSIPVGVAVEIGHSSRTILDHAEKSETDCIVISSHKPGIGDYLLGSTAGRVVRHAKCAVHVLR